MSTPAATENPPEWLPTAQIQRDLRWCLQTPPLLGGLPEPLKQPLSELLPVLSQRLDPGPIASQGRLGPYYEQLWQALLCQGLDHQLIAHDRQLFDGQRTLGALDLLTYDRAQQCYWHLELAAKLYLCTDTGEQYQHWLGPDSRDRLDLKRDHLLNRQLPLAGQPNCRLQIDQWTQALNLPSVQGRLHSVGLMQGWLFLPWQQPGLRPAVSRGQVTGLWAHWHNWPQLNEQYRRTGECWLMLPKRYWLSAFACAETDPLSAAAQLPASRQQRPVLMALCRVQAGQWRERMRVMLVSDQWPDRPDHRAAGNRS